jgi:hypothetical protein
MLGTPRSLILCVYSAPSSPCSSNSPCRTACGPRAQARAAAGRAAAPCKRGSTGRRPRGSTC